MSKSARLSLPAQEVRHLDRDRFITVLLASPDRREALYGLYAFNLEIARIRELVTQPQLGQIRFQWWRDTLDSIFSGQSVSHPVAEALSSAVRDFELSRSPFDRLLDARQMDLDNGPLPDLAAMEFYAEGTSSTLNALAIEILGVRDDAAFRAARHVGIAWALTGLLRAVPFHAAGGRLYLPASLLAEQGVDGAEVLAGNSPAGLARVAEAIAARAKDHLVRARAYQPEVPKGAVSALLTGILAERYLDRLARTGFDLLDTGWSLTRPRPLKLAISTWLGRY